MPVNDAGRRMEPPVSSPTPISPRLAEMATPVPLLEPPTSRARSYGLCVRWETEEVENQPVAQSVRISLVFHFHVLVMK